MKTEKQFKGYTAEEINKMSDLEVQQKLKVCPICWSEDHVSGECEQYNPYEEDEK